MREGVVAAERRRAAPGAGCRRAAPRVQDVRAGVAHGRGGAERRPVGARRAVVRRRRDRGRGRVGHVCAHDRLCVNTVNVEARQRHLICIPVERMMATGRAMTGGGGGGSMLVAA